MIRAGDIIHRDKAHQVDLSRYRLSWRPDNTARVTLRADAPPLWICRYHADCPDALRCDHARAHNPRLPDRLCGDRMVWDIQVQL